MSGRRSLSDYEPGRRGVSVADLDDGETLVVHAIAQAYLAETEFSDDAIHVPCQILEAPEGFQDMSDEAVETQQNSDDPMEYNIINSSTAFYEAIIREFGPDVDLNGQMLEITASQPGDSFSRTYSIDAK